jgi:hypothetical protein
MPVHILKPDRTPFSVNRQTAIVGFTLRGEDVRVFEEAAFDAIALAPGDIVVGGIGFVQRALKRLGLAVPQLDSVPASLADFADRKTWQGPLIEARRAVERGRPVFVKPLPDQPKLFTGRPMREFADLIDTAHLADDLIVECSELRPFVSEFRAFILHGEIIDVRPYKGDPLVFPDADRVRSAVLAHADAPAAYAMDVGVGEDGVTRLVEVNDGYAIGAYGLAPMRYATMIDARWAELRNASP